MMVTDATRRIDQSKSSKDGKEKARGVEMAWWTQKDGEREGRMTAISSLYKEANGDEEAHLASVKIWSLAIFITLP